MITGRIEGIDRTKPLNFFTCETCKDHPQMNGMKKLKKHLAEKHRVTKMEGTKKGVIFLDGRGFWEQIYTVEIGGIKIVQDVGGPTGHYGKGS